MRYMLCIKCCVLNSVRKYVADKYSERYQADIIDVYGKFKMVAVMAAKLGTF